MKLNVSFEESPEINVRFSQFECTFKPDFGEIVTVRNNDIYEGDYNITPRVYEQILETKDKLMLNNITVEIIPLTRVVNLADGYTITIG